MSAMTADEAREYSIAHSDHTVVFKVCPVCDAHFVDRGPTASIVNEVVLKRHYEAHTALEWLFTVSALQLRIEALEATQ